MGILEQGQQIERTLNTVKTVGQARGAVKACLQSLDKMLSQVQQFWVVPIVGAWQTARDSIVGGPATDTAIREKLTMLRVALKAEERNIKGVDGESVDADSWARIHRQLTRSYIEIAGAEGALSARPDLAWHLDNLTDSIGALAPFAIGIGLVAIAAVVAYVFLIRGK